MQPEVVVKVQGMAGEASGSDSHIQPGLLGHCMARVPVRSLKPPEKQDNT